MPPIFFVLLALVYFIELQMSILFIYFLSYYFLLPKNANSHRNRPNKRRTYFFISIVSLLYIRQQHSVKINFDKKSKFSNFVYTF